MGILPGFGVLPRPGLYHEELLGQHAHETRVRIAIHIPVDGPQAGKHVIRGSRQEEFVFDLQPGDHIHGEEVPLGVLILEGRSD